MRYLKKYEELGLKNKENVFDFLINTLKPSNTSFDFFVDWKKIFQKVEDIEIGLNILNYLVGKEKIEEELKKLIKKYPEIVSILPSLISLRNNEMEILIDYETRWIYETFSFEKKEKYSEKEIDKIVRFCRKTGILNILQTEKIKNVVDYYTGIEVGNDTNARKNRSGKFMEKIVENYIKEILRDKNNIIVQATKKKVYRQWKIDLPIDKTSRRYDFAIKHNNKLILIETNFYSNGGSKLKSTAGEYKMLDTFLKKHGCVDKFVWITDGQGWKTAENALRETFYSIDFLINIEMVLKGILEEIVYF
jgi:type II restriction enzyme